MRQLGGTRLPSRHDGNAAVSLVLAGAACVVGATAGLWLWRSHPTPFWVVVAALVVTGVCLAALDTAAGVRGREREARRRRSQRTQERFLQHLRDGAEPGPGGVT